MVLHIILTKVREQGKGIFKSFFLSSVYGEEKKLPKRFFYNIQYQIELLYGSLQQYNSTFVLLK